MFFQVNLSAIFNFMEIKYLFRILLKNRISNSGPINSSVQTQLITVIGRQDRMIVLSLSAFHSKNGNGL